MDKDDKGIWEEIHHLETERRRLKKEIREQRLQILAKIRQIETERYRLLKEIEEAEKSESPVAENFYDLLAGNNIDSFESTDTKHKRLAVLEARLAILRGTLRQGP